MKIAYTKAKRSGADEVYTPTYAIKPILKYLNPNLKVWCPFDTEESEFVNVLSSNGNKVIYSHIDNGQDFFSYEPEEEYDIIISNPPYSTKDLVLKRLFELKKPFMVLLPIQALQGVRRFPYLVDCQALIFDKRINFFKDFKTKEIQKGISFGTFYLCKGVLPKDLIFEKLEV